MKRMTKQRQAIWELLRTEKNFLSAQEVHDLLDQSGESIGLATVYRNLQALANNGSVDVLRLEKSRTNSSATVQKTFTTTILCAVHAEKQSKYLVQELKSGLMESQTNMALPACPIHSKFSGSVPNVPSTKTSR